MSFQATVINVMIAAPSDVVKEPEIIREILDEWNETDSERSKIVALPIGWKTHASPEAGDRAQAIINHQVLDKADILVAVFWTRLGTPTGEYASGTVEEIKRSIRDNRRVMLYFSDAPIQPSQMEEKQRGILADFREEIKDIAYFGIYSDLEDFRKNLRRDIRRSLGELEESLPRRSTADVSEKGPDWENTLTEKSKELLKKAANAGGDILRIAHSGGVDITIGSEDIVEEGNPRNTAQCEEALEQLCNENLINHISEVMYRVTNRGYQVSDSLLD